jgi:hypothetical protein
MGCAVPKRHLRAEAISLFISAGLTILDSFPNQHPEVASAHCIFHVVLLLRLAMTAALPNRII